MPSFNHKIMGVTGLLHFETEKQSTFQGSIFILQNHSKMPFFPNSCKKENSTRIHAVRHQMANNLNFTEKAMAGLKFLLKRL